MGSYLSSNAFPVEGRTVLITGGSKGLGLEAARQLSAKGASIVVVARGGKSLDEAIVSISKSAPSPESQRFHSIRADVTSAPECAHVVNEVVKWNHGAPPDIVWCCSGSAHPSLFIDTPLDQFQTMMDSNYFSCVYMAHAVLNVWLRPCTAIARDEESPTHLTTAKSGTLPARHIVFTGSFVSFYSFAGYAPYSPSKAAIRALSDALSQEMNLYAAAHPTSPRVRVHTVFPATMPTQSLIDEDRVKSDLTKNLEEGDQILQPEECALRAIAGLEAGEELVPTSTIIRLVMTSVLGGSVRGGFWKGLVNTLLGWVTLIVMVFIRWEMDGKVKKWGRKYGSSGMRKKTE
ncbi:NAD(P)-binding protein [Lentithecium fluviatile CBS 122367]|uniref:3-dehydrosphinganine reductase n=1 Tax=Lentithecium fluviatile CBS 122367 TaxID=1168545 RepID=A0A6G1IZ49_9PLEO|nr:NAD(P)-binding protein [Lentithecium fluviatile CBS 122367]